MAPIRCGGEIRAWSEIYWAYSLAHSLTLSTHLYTRPGHEQDAVV